MSIIDAIFRTPTQTRSSGWEILGDREYNNDEAGLSPKYLSEQVAMRYAPVWQAVSLLSGDICGLPLNHYRRRENNSRMLVKDEIQQVIRWKANPWQTAFRFWRVMVAQALLWRASFAYIALDESGNLAGLYPIWPGSIKVVHKGTSVNAGKSLGPNSEVYYEYTDDEGNKNKLRYDMVLHINGVSILPTVGLSLVEYAGSAIALGLAAETFGLQFLKNAARPSGYVKMEGHIKDETAQQRFINSFRSAYAGAANSGRVPLLEDGAEFKPLSYSNEEAQYNETRKEQVRVIASYFNLPPHKLGDDTRVSYNSLEQENQSYLTSSLLPWLNTIASECYLKLLGDDEQKQGLEYFEHNTTAILKADFNTRTTGYKTLREIGVFSADDIAERENMEPIGPDNGGDVRYVPSNWMRLGESMVKPDQQPNDQNGDDGGTQDQPPPEPSRQSVPLLPATGGRDATGPVARLLEETLRRHVRRIIRKSDVSSSDRKRYSEFVDSTESKYERDLLYDILQPVSELSESLGVHFDRFDIADWTLGHAAEEYDRLQDTETAETLPAAVADLNTRLLRELPHEAAQMILEPAGEEL